MPKAELNILVISDLHAHSQDPLSGTAPSYLSTRSMYATADSNPLVGVSELIKGDGLKVDWILSPGDLGDRADPSAQKDAWLQLDRTREKVGAEYLVATAGNHDIDSRRRLPEFDPKSALQSLAPRFPVDRDCYVSNDGVFQDRYWSRNFVLIPAEEFDCSLLIINSCAFHGYASEEGGQPTEHLRGKLSQYTLEAIKEATSSLETKVNIALVHHHLQKHPWVEGDESVMVGGDRLIDILKDSDRHWTVIHGHQHIPYLVYAGAGPFAPVLLSSGSVAAKTYPVKGRHSRNQVHHIRIAASEMDSLGGDVLGAVTSWTWASQVGWQRATPDGGIPYKAGFGFRPDLVQLRDQLAELVAASPNQLAKWEAIVEGCPKLQYLIPEDLIGLLKLLDKKDVSAEIGQWGQPLSLEHRS